jgi:hypothetical protein
MSTSIHSREPGSSTPPTNQFCRAAVPENGRSHLAPATGTGDNFARMQMRLEDGGPDGRREAAA